MCSYFDFHSGATARGAVRRRPSEKNSTVPKTVERASRSYPQDGECSLDVLPILIAALCGLRGCAADDALSVGVGIGIGIGIGVGVSIGIGIGIGVGVGIGIGIGIGVGVGVGIKLNPDSPEASSQCSRSRSLSVQQVTLPLSAAVPETE